MDWSTILVVKLDLWAVVLWMNLQFLLHHPSMKTRRLDCMKTSAQGTGHGGDMPLRAGKGPHEANNLIANLSEREEQRRQSALK